MRSAFSAATAWWIAWSSVKISEGLMRQMMRLEIAPDGFDVVQFWRILGQPLDGEPVRAGGQRGQGEVAGVDRTIVLDQHHRLDGLAGPGTIKAATKSRLRFVGLVCTMSRPET